MDGNFIENKDQNLGTYQQKNQNLFFINPIIVLAHLQLN